MAMSSIPKKRGRKPKSVETDTVNEDNPLSKRPSRRRAAATKLSELVLRLTSEEPVVDDDDEAYVSPVAVESDADESDVHEEDSEIEEVGKKLTKKRAKELKKPTTKKIKTEKQSNSIPGDVEDITDAKIPLQTLSDDPFENFQLNYGPNPFYNVNEPGNNGVRKIGNSLKDRLFHIFGFNQKRLSDLVKLEELTRYNFFHPSITRMKDLHLNDLFDPLTDVGDPQISKLTFQQYQKLFNCSVTLKLTNIHDNGSITELAPGAAVNLSQVDPKFNNNQSLVLNTGGLPVDIAWNIQSHDAQDSHLQLFAVSLSATVDITDPKFSVYGAQQDRSQADAVNIYQLDTSNGTIKLFKSYLHNLGVASCLKWLPEKASGKTLGTLAAIFGDGLLKMIKVQHDGVVLCQLTSPSYSFSLPETLITAFDLISNQSLVIGTRNGYIGELDLQSRKISYLYPLLTRGITVITSNFADYYHDHDLSFLLGEYQLKNKVVLVGSIDMNFVIDLNDIVNQQYDGIKSRTMIVDACYSPLLHSFAINDGSRVTKLFSKRDSQTTMNIFKNETASTGLCSSRLHGLLICGSSDGELFISDATKRLFSIRKSTVSSKFPVARLSRLEYSSKKNCFRFNPILMVDTVSGKEYDSSFVFNSPKVVVRKVAWNENLSHGNWYAATYLGGLILVDKLPSVKTVRHYNGQ